MPTLRLFLVGLATAAVASCSPQAASAPPAPAASSSVAGVAGLPFEVPDGALFVARSRGASNIYRIQESCAVLSALNPEHVVFFWTLEAAKRSGFRLSKDEGCS